MVALLETWGVFGVHDLVWEGMMTGCVIVVLCYVGQRAIQKAEEVKLELQKATNLADQRAHDIKRDLERVKAHTEQQLLEISRVGRITHSLVNSDMLEQKRLVKDALKRLALSTDTPEDRLLAELAEKHYQEHVQKQKQVDLAAAVELTQ